jgi:hypothetical protein
VVQLEIADVVILYCADWRCFKQGKSIAIGQLTYKQSLEHGAHFRCF